jgi:hypothetical protein
MLFPAAVAVVDAELGFIVRLTSYIGAKPVWRHELEGLTPVTGDFQVSLPTGLPVTKAGLLDDIGGRTPPASLPAALGRVVARHAAAGAARTVRNLLNRLGPREPEYQQRCLRATGAQREREEDNCAKQCAAKAEPRLGFEVLPFQVGDAAATQMGWRGQFRPVWQWLRTLAGQQPAHELRAWAPEACGMPARRCSTAIGSSLTR